MDRLICGDVGFGKTEVAIRAAFKAVMDGKQVAVLVPTTVLAQQHYNTFRERMADYPVRLELLSRFRTGREQQRRDPGSGRRRRWTLSSARTGWCRRTSRSKTLGLVVIDEEQRFGVLHKERFKLLRTAGGRAHTERHAHSAHAVPGADRRARHEHHSNAAARPPAGGNHRHPVRRTAHSRRHPARAQPRRPGFLSAQPRD